MHTGTLPATTPNLSHVSRRLVLQRLGAIGVGAAAVAGAPRRARAQGKAPVKLTFWTWENPQQRPYIVNRINMYMQKNPHVQVDVQVFTFGDLGKKVSIGFATGTAPDGFATGDWLMPTWLGRNLIAPQEAQLLGYPAVDAFRKDHADAFVQGSIHDGKVYGLPTFGSTPSRTGSTPSISRKSASIRTRMRRRPGSSSARSPSG